MCTQTVEEIHRAAVPCLCDCSKAHQACRPSALVPCNVFLGVLCVPWLIWCLASMASKLSQKLPRTHPPHASYSPQAL